MSNLKHWTIANTTGKQSSVAVNMSSSLGGITQDS